MKHYLGIITGMLLLPSCGNNTRQAYKQSASKKIKTTKADSYIAKKIQKKDTATFDFVRIQEAKLLDIPIPVSAQPMPEYFDPTRSSIMLGYQDKRLSMIDIRDFYLCEMERLGWQIEEQFLGYEIQLRFIRPPDRTCLISIRCDQTEENIKFIICSGSKAELIA